ncbi:MAG: hypothetical protein ABFR90_11470 [Planctomycetota bacterium]
MNTFQRQWFLAGCLFFLCFLGVAAAVVTGQVKDSETLDKTIDLDVVQQKIESLGLRDDTLTYYEQPDRWLKNRREKIVPQLIKGLDSNQKRIALGCLKVLDGVEGNKDFLDALLRISNDRDHLICKEAILSLCKYSDNEYAKGILKEAFDGKKRFNKDERAQIAIALGRESEAVELLVSLFESYENRDYERKKIIRRLGETGYQSVLSFLKKVSKSHEWAMAKEAYRAMAKIAPDRYGLTEDQQTFLNKARGTKENSSDRIKRFKGLADLNKEEIRPFVMQMIHSDYPEPGLIVLQVWKDKNAMAQIEKLMKEGDTRSWQRRPFIAAYLDIEGTDESITTVISMTDRQPRKSYGDSFSVEDVMYAVMQSVMSEERKLTVLRRFRNELGSFVVAKSLRRSGEETPEILRLLMTEETDIRALGEYVRTVAMDTEKRFGEEVYAALERLSSKETLSSNDEHGAQLILDGCAAYQLAESGKLADKFLTPDSSVYVRIAAARVSATLGGNRGKALNILYEELNNSNPVVRKQSSTCLVSVKCLSDTERLEREKIILLHLGQPTEDYALRVLTTCSGEETAKKLLPILDEENVRCTVYAVWILAQHPDEAIKQKGLRRVAVYAMFNHQIYQQGEGIDFTIAPDLSFHQVTGYLNRRDYQQKRRPVQIPDNFLVPFELDENEQSFAIRAYRHTRFRRIFDIGFPPFYLHNRRDVSWDASHLPLFQVIAVEDPYLGILYVKGKKVAHFKNRKPAAEIIADITKTKSSYTGLAGEAIDSEQTPLQPYKNQNKLIAQYILDQIESIEIPTEPQQQRLEYNVYRRCEALERMMRNLVHELGDDLKKELIAESVNRGIAEDLKNTRYYSIWRDYE